MARWAIGPSREYKEIKPKWPVGPSAQVGNTKRLSIQSD